jgi:hypothetical protein
VKALIVAIGFLETHVDKLKAGGRPATRADGLICRRPTAKTGTTEMSEITYSVALRRVDD